MNDASPAAQQFVAGLVAGATATLCMHPLDLIKTRMQVQTASSGRYKLVISSLNERIVQGGLIQTLYRGLALNLVGSAASWGLYFMWYGQFKRLYNKPNLSSSDYFIASGLAGAATTVCTNPLWVVKTRVLTTDRRSTGAYKGLIDGLFKISKVEGIHGLYRGLVPSLFGVPHGALQFLVYEKLKEWRRTTGSPLSNLEYTTFSAVSKIVATLTTYPYQVIRSRLQVSSNLTYTVRSMVINTWKNEGFPGFYRGLLAQIIRTLPGACVTLVVYENIMNHL